jgi:hypothetical protein
MMGFLLVSPVSALLIANGAHALFTIMSAFALAHVISFYRERKPANLRVASVFVGLAILSRMGEGTFLFGSLIALSILLGMPARGVKAALAAAVTPALVVVGGYMLVYYSLIGKSPLGTGAYFYTAFEQGYGQANADQFPGLRYWVEGEVEARRIFGTPEENQYSVIAAIQRNPAAYLNRIPRLAKQAVGVSVGIYGGPLSVWFFLLAIQGCLELVKKKQVMLLCILLLWPSYLVLYILLVFQTTHLLLPFPLLFCLASIGLTAFVSFSGRQRSFWSAVLFGLAAFAIVRGVSLPFVYSVLVLLIGLWIVWTALNRFRNSEVAIPLAFLFLLSMMLLFRESVPSHGLRRLGIAADERAMLFMKRNFEEGTAIGAYAPREIWAAKMKRVTLVNRRSELRSEQQLQSFIRDYNLEAIYMDSDFRKDESAVWSLIDSQIGKSMEVAFSSDEPYIRILRVSKTNKSNLP